MLYTIEKCRQFRKLTQTPSHGRELHLSWRKCMLHFNSSKECWQAVRMDEILETSCEENTNVFPEKGRMGRGIHHMY